ncbi:MAG: hypothetical protein ACM3O3_00025 [Syntrophothermus sp.]
MPLLTRTDLLYKYNWSHNYPNFSELQNNPDKVMLNKNEGEEVLYLINKIAEMNQFTNKSLGHKIETMIKHYLPENYKSHNKAIAWINTNL